MIISPFSLSERNLASDNNSCTASLCMSIVSIVLRALYRNLTKMKGRTKIRVGPVPSIPSKIKTALFFWFTLVFISTPNFSIHEASHYCLRKQIDENLMSNRRFQKLTQTTTVILRFIVWNLTKLTKMLSKFHWDVPLHSYPANTSMNQSALLLDNKFAELLNF